MELEEIFKLIDEKKDSHYIMDRCLMWFLYRYKVLKWDLEDYYEMPSVFEPNTHGQIQRMSKEVAELSINTHFGNLIIELNSEVMHIMMATLPGGEKFRVRNLKEDLALRDKLMKEVEKNKAEFESKKITKNNNYLQSSQIPLTSN